jgi:hypothetical protein
VKILTNLTSDAKQQTSLLLDDGSQATWLLEYRPNQQAWFYDLTWGNVVISGQRLVPSPNMIRQFRTRLPFGIAILTAGNVEVMNQQDFTNGNAIVYQLDAADVAEIEASEGFLGY